MLAPSIARQRRRPDNDVKMQLRALLASLIDAETGERGYIITGNESYLEPYNRGVATTDT